MNGANSINRPDISQVLNEMRALKTRVDSFKAPGVSDDVAANGISQVQPTRTTDFQALLANAVEQVNEVQKESGRLSQSFQQGDPATTLSEVVIASEKAGIAFEAMTEVRNKLVNAYEDIMNMPI